MLFDSRTAAKLPAGEIGGRKRENMSDDFRDHYAENLT